MTSRISNFVLGFQLRLLAALSGLKSRFSDERGDTNFISIAIILIVVIGLAIVFITLGDEITGWVGDAIEKLKDALGI